MKYLFHICTAFLAGGEGRTRGKNRRQTLNADISADMRTPLSLLFVADTVFVGTEEVVFDLESAATARLEGKL